MINGVWLLKKDGIGRFFFFLPFYEGWDWAVTFSENENEEVRGVGDSSTKDLYVALERTAVSGVYELGLPLAYSTHLDPLCLLVKGSGKAPGKKEEHFRKPFRKHSLERKLKSQNSAQ